MDGRTRQVNEENVNTFDSKKVDLTLTQPLSEKLAECKNIRQVESVLKSEGCENIKTIPPGIMNEDYTITFTKDKLNYS